MEIKDRVLVVEDDKRISNFIKTVLEANNYDVIVAQTGAEAYSMVTSQCPDVVILDLGLPDMDGMKILQGVRETFRNIRASREDPHCDPPHKVWDPESAGRTDGGF